MKKYRKPEIGDIVEGGSAFKHYSTERGCYPYIYEGLDEDGQAMVTPMFGYDSESVKPDFGRTIRMNPLYVKVPLQ